MEGCPTAAKTFRPRLLKTEGTAPDAGIPTALHFLRSAGFVVVHEKIQCICKYPI